MTLERRLARVERALATSQSHDTAATLETEARQAERQAWEQAWLALLATMDEQQATAVIEHMDQDQDALRRTSPGLWRLVRAASELVSDHLRRPGAPLALPA